MWGSLQRGNKIHCGAARYYTVLNLCGVSWCRMTLYYISCSLLTLYYTKLQMFCFLNWFMTVLVKYSGASITHWPNCCVDIFITVMVPIHIQISKSCILGIFFTHTHKINTLFTVFKMEPILQFENNSTEISSSF